MRKTVCIYIYITLYVQYNMLTCRPTLYYCRRGDATPQNVIIYSLARPSSERERVERKIITKEGEEKKKGKKKVK